MDLEQLQDLAEKKLKINDTELDLESLKTPQLHNEFLKHLTKFKLLLSKAQIEYYTQRRQKWEYYTGKADPAVYQLKPFNRDINRNFNKEGKDRISSIILDYAKRSDLIVDLHEGYEYHKRYPQSMGSSIIPNQSKLAILVSKKS